MFRGGVPAAEKAEEVDPKSRSLVGGIPPQRSLHLTFCWKHVRIGFCCWKHVRIGFCCWKHVRIEFVLFLTIHLATAVHWWELHPNEKYIYKKSLSLRFNIGMEIYFVDNKRNTEPCIYNHKYLNWRLKPEPDKRLPICLHTSFRAWKVVNLEES